MDLVNVCFLGREGNIVADLGTDIAEEGIVDEVLDDGMLVSRD